MGDVWASLVYVADTEPRVMDGPRRGQGFLDAMSRPGLVGSADGYHVIRLAVVPGINDDATTLSVAQDAPMMANAYGRKITIWCDEHLGNTEPVVEIYNTNQYQAPGNWTSYHGFQFGLQEQLAGHEAWYDWISFTNAGAFGPGEEVALIGKSLIPTKCRACNMEYWADIDGDNDVDQDDYARFQRCYSGSDNPYPVTPGYCACFDRDGDGDIDAEDLAAFTSCTTGPGIAGPPASCAQ